MDDLCVHQDGSIAPGKFKENIVVSAALLTLRHHNRELKDY